MAIRNKKQQWAVLILMVLLLGGLYTFKRGIARYQQIQRQDAQLAQHLETIKNPKFPEEPLEDIEDLQGQIDKLEAGLAYTRQEAERLEEKMAPTDTQDVLLKISDAARTASVKIIENVPYLVERVAEQLADKSKNKAKKLSKRELKKLKKMQKKMAKKGRAFNQLEGTVGAVPKEGELIYQVVNSLDEARPLQLVTVEGTYGNLLAFIEAVQGLPWQVTVMKLDIDVNIQTPPQGIPQPIKAKMILAM